MRFVLAYVGVLTQVLIYCIVAWSLISWFPIRRDNPALVILRHIAEPLVNPLRRIVPRVGILDLTPLAAILILIAIPYVLRLIF
ncbi:MAG: YggT family protein [Chloroflexi bacterium]|nr:YggT family protein [Chloroflexota bacterium]